MPRTTLSAKRLLALLMSTVLAASMSFTGGIALSVEPAEAGLPAPSEAVSIEDVSDVSFAPSRDLALTAEMLSSSSTDNRVSYLDAQMEASSRLGEMITLVEPNTYTIEPTFSDDMSSGIRWRDSASASFMGRLDTSVADYALTAYDAFKEMSDFDGNMDNLISDSAYSLVSKDPDVSWKTLEVGDPVRGKTMSAFVVAKVAVPAGTDLLTAPYADNISNWMQAAWSAYLRDCPEYTFWYTRGLPGITAAKINDDKPSGKDIWGIFIVTASSASTIRNSVWDTSAKIQQTHSAMMSRVDEIVNGMPSTTDFDKVDYFNDWLCANNQYYSSYNTETDHIPWTAASALLSPDETYSLVGLRQGPVCEGFSKAMLLLCEKANVPCTVQTGDAGGPHMWNLVRLQGKWYIVDVTHNDAGATSSDAWMAVGSDKLAPNNRTVSDAVIYTVYKTDAAGKILEDASGKPIVDYTFEYPFANAPAIASSVYVYSPALDVDISLSGSIVYGDTAQISVTGAPQGANLSYSASKGELAFFGNSVTFESAGDAIITVTVNAADGTSFEVDYPLTVDKRPLSIEVTPEGKSYDATVSVPGFDVKSSNIVKGDLIDVTLSNARFADPGVGEAKKALFDVTVTGSKAGCYSYPATVEGHARISPCDIGLFPVSFPEQRIGAGTLAAGLPKTLAFEGFEGDVDTVDAEWYADEACTQKVPAAYKLEGEPGQLVTLYAKVSAKGNYTGTNVAPVAFELTAAEPPAGDDPSSTPQPTPDEPAGPPADDPNKPSDDNKGDSNANQDASEPPAGDDGNEPLSGTDNPPDGTAPPSAGANSVYVNNGGAGSAANGPFGAITKTGDVIPLALVIVALSSIVAGAVMLAMRRR